MKRDRSKESSSKLKKLLEERLQALKSFDELRVPLWEAVASELDRSGAKKSFSERAAHVSKQMQTAFQQFRAGKLSRDRAIDSYQHALNDLHKDFGDRSIDALWKNAKLQPSIPEVMLAWYGKPLRHPLIKIVPDRYLGWFLENQMNSPTDVGTSQQALGGAPAPPPFGFCAMPPYPVHEDRGDWQGIGADLAMSTPSAGACLVQVFGDLAGGASAHSLVGTDFDIPAGFTNISVTASATFNFSGFTYTIGGAAGVGADFWLWIEDPVGADPVEKSQGLFSLLSPVIWGNSANGMGDAAIVSSIATPDAAARTIRVFAGLAAHAECFSTFSAACVATVECMVTKICVMAT